MPTGCLLSIPVKSLVWTAITNIKVKLAERFLSDEIKMKHFGTTTPNVEKHVV